MKKKGSKQQFILLSSVEKNPESDLRCCITAIISEPHYCPVTHPFIMMDLDTVGWSEQSTHAILLQEVTRATKYASLHSWRSLTNTIFTPLLGKLSTQLFRILLNLYVCLLFLKIYSRNLSFQGWETKTGRCGFKVWTGRRKLLLVLVVTKTRNTEYCWSFPFLGKRSILRRSHISDYRPLHVSSGQRRYLLNEA